MDISVKNRCGKTTFTNSEYFIVDIDSYSIIINTTYNNYKKEGYGNRELIIYILLHYYVNSLSIKDKLLLSIYFNNIDCNDNELVKYIDTEINKGGIFKINTHINECKKQCCYIISIKNISFLLNVDKKDINNYNSVDEYLRLKELKNKIKNF